ncbi:G-protein coupled receptor frpr-1 [Biomphalaria glabrata]|nr:putative G-protein coupled receptor frpr-1 [Biomphalaria glabrata]
MGYFVSSEILGEIIFDVRFGILFPLAFIGMITNTLTLLVFYKQGFQEGTTITMTSIALWNWLKCVCGLMSKMYFIISFVDQAFGVTWDNITFPYIEYTTIYAGYVTFSLAAFLSVERFLCVWKPFTAKSLLTPTTIFLSVVIISIGTFGAYVVVYFAYTIKFEYSQTFNTTVAIYVFSYFYYQKSAVFMVYYQVQAILIPAISFILMSLFSLATVYYLKKNSQYLHKQPSLKTKAPSREKQVSKALLVVVLVYIINLFPRFVFYIAQLAEPEFYMLRKYNDEFTTAAVFIFIIDLINACSHLFIFAAFSSTFREHVMSLFLLKTF